MQFTRYFIPALFPTAIINKTSVPTGINRRSRCSPIKAEVPTVDYSSMTSVFPVEACETIGGEACDVEMYPEASPKPEPETGNKGSNNSEELMDREYLEYNNPKTVFPGEACDDLGGEFCEAEYQKGVH